MAVPFISFHARTAIALAVCASLPVHIVVATSVMHNGAVPASVAADECHASTQGSASITHLTGQTLTEAELETLEEEEVKVLDVRLLQRRLGMQAGLTTGGPDGEQQPSFGFRSQGVPNASSALVTGQVCLTEVDCCPKDVPGECPFFCKEGSEIDKSSAKGWEVKGSCTQKWLGFCLEDEECGQGAICQRDAGSLAGTCSRDARCDSLSCGRGHCRSGRCTCDYGVSGERCDRSLEAFAFLFYGNSSENVISVRVLVKSLRASGAPQDIVAIVPTDLASQTPQDLLHLLQEDGVKIHFSEPIPMPASMDSDPIIHKRWSGVMNKFGVWRLTDYSQVALLDTDMVFSFDTESPDRIFSECGAPLCAVRDGDSRFMNAGVMVVVPSRQRLAHIMHVLSNEQHHFAMPEQSFLTRYCQNPVNRMPLQFLDRKWNSCVGGGMLRNLGWESTGYNVLHSCSWTGKPPNMRICLPGACDSDEESHTVLVWQFFHMQADPCIRHTQETSCHSVGLTRACSWCEHYCGDARVPCSGTLFNQTYSRGGDEPDLVKAGLSGLSGHDVSLGSFGGTTAEWNKLPRGSWAWPQVAMYQILIDRFAAPSPTHCEKLEDYCGGTISGIRSKLDYLKALGVDGVVLSPIVEQMPHGYHGYWTKDLYSVNPEYGTEEDVKDLVVLLHERRMKVVVDVNLNHAGGPDTNASSPASLAALRPFNDPSFFHADNCSLMHNEDYERGPTFLERCKLYGLPDYNHENPVVWQRLMHWVRSHVDKYGFDGIRVDAARHILRSFLDHIPQTGPPIPAFFEVVNGETKYVSSYATGDYNAVYNYPLYFMLRDIFVPGPGQRPMGDLADWMTNEAEFTGGRLMLNFLDNNDLPRFIYKLDGDQLLYHNALLCVLSMEGLPVLLYGSEQNQRGVLNFSDPLKVDNWRPPLWHAGYNTSTSTFQLIKKVLWLRQRMNGMHELTQRPLFADHKVLVFARGPVVFAVTNVGRENPVPSQRVLWDNATSGFPWSVTVCNLLAIQPWQDCGIIAPGNLSRLHLLGDPKVYVPTDFLREYETSVKRDLEAKQSELSRAAEAPKVLPFPSWRDMPGPPALAAHALKRVQRAWRPGDVMLNDDPSLIWHHFPGLPPHLDRWGPPLGVPAPHVVSASLHDACFYLGAGEKDGAMVARRGNETFVLCPDSAEMCPLVVGKNIDLGRLGALVGTFGAPLAKPVVHLTYDSWYGVYHMLVSALPSIAPHLAELRSGRMLAFLHTGQSVVAPVLAHLGVEWSVFFPPQEPPLARPFHFCAPVMHFEVGTRPQYPRAQFVARHLHDFRRALALQEAPCAPKLGGIVLLSRGNQSRTLSNEAEVAAALRTLGRPVTVLYPEPSGFRHMLEVLSQAAVLVGAHGANMANMIYAPEGVTVVEIVPQVSFGLVDFHFWDLAGGLNFTYVPFGQPVRSDESHPELTKDPMVQDKALQSYEANAQKVKELVGSLL
mmetsp:Transcript_107565/g.304183  ORF Transcript_107565/g.304183 Transcript_107565/m.304183 type:complete len:1470 (-) Transcript_107565:383-4792(-)